MGPPAIKGAGELYLANQEAQSPRVLPLHALPPPTFPSTETSITVPDFSKAVSVSAFSVSVSFPFFFSSSTTPHTHLVACCGSFEATSSPQCRSLRAPTAVSPSSSSSRLPKLPHPPSRSSRSAASEPPRYVFEPIPIFCSFKLQATGREVARQRPAVQNPNLTFCLYSTPPSRMLPYQPMPLVTRASRSSPWPAY